MHKLWLATLLGALGMLGMAQAQEPDTGRQFKNYCLLSRPMVIDSNDLSPGNQLALVRAKMAQRVYEGQYDAVDSLMQNASSLFAAGLKPLFLTGRERVLLYYLQGKASTWLDLGLLHRTLKDLHIGFIASRRQFDGRQVQESLEWNLEESARSHHLEIESKLNSDPGLNPEQRDFLKILLRKLLISRDSENEDDVFAYSNVASDREAFIAEFGKDEYTAYAQNYFPSPLHPHRHGFGMSLGYGGISLPTRATEGLGDPRIFAWDITWYSGYFAFSGLAHFTWDMQVQRDFTYHGNWPSGWSLNGIDAGLSLGYRLFPYSPISLEPHLGLHWFDLTHEDQSTDDGLGPEDRHMPGETEIMGGLSADWNWLHSNGIRRRYNPSALYLRFTLDWLHAPMDSHHPEFAGDALAFYVSVGGLFKESP